MTGQMGPAAIKRYDKFGLILRIETTVNDVSFSQHYRTVEERDGATVTKRAPRKKSIYSLGLARSPAGGESALPGVPLHPRGPHRRVDRLRKVTETLRENERCYPGFNFFAAEDQRLFETLARGKFNLHGLQNKTVRRHLPEKTPGQISRLLKRLRLHGLLKKVARSYRYYLTHFGKQVIATGLKLKQLIPQLAAMPSR